MAKRPSKKTDKQLDLPAPPLASTTRILPMDLRVGDRLTDERGEWRVVNRPYTTAAGKVARARVELVGQPHIHEIRVWSARERVSVRRASAEVGTR